MKKSVVILTHLLFWALVFSIIPIFNWAFEYNRGFIKSFFDIWISDVFEKAPLHIIQMLFFYLFYSLFQRKIFSQNNYRYKVGAILSIFGTPAALIIIVNGFIHHWVISITELLSRFYSEAFLVTTRFAMLGLLFRIMFEGIDNTIDIKKQNVILQKQNLESELALLKNQINPHFFFNTMNNIDSLIKSNADKASETLIKLSEMMRYMIYETNEEWVALAQEIEHIEHYFDLQKIQYSNPKAFSFTVTGDSKGIYVAPMIFIPFVENAFKHCTNKSINNAITIEMLIDKGSIIFDTVNIYDKTQIINKDATGGVGLNVIKRRLEIIYPNNHSLEITDENNLFKVKLTLQIHED